MEYNPSILFKHHHFSTMYPSLFRKVKNVTYNRERITTPDEDFIDLDWSKNGSKALAVVCHGLEGSADSAYVRGMVRAFNGVNWDAVGYNYRSCSGEPNRLLKAYHAGATDDLDTVLQHILATSDYDKIALIGFSLGGNLVLRYFGESPDRVPEQVKTAVAISAPVDLAGCAKTIAQPHNFVYNQRFVRKLRVKTEWKKAQILAAGLDYETLYASKSLTAFDDLFTAPVNGFKDAADYWAKCSAKPVLTNIQRPSLLLNALNDPFLSKSCFPYEAAAANPFFELKTTNYGGHVGFAQFNKVGLYWNEAFVIQWTMNLIVNS